MKRFEYLMAVMTALFMICSTGAAAADGQTWWGYWTSPRGLEEVAPFNAGDNSCSVRVLATANPRLVGCKLHGLRFYISDKTQVTAATAWATGRNYGDRKAEVTIAADALRDVVHDGAATEVRFAEPIDLLPSTNRYASAYVGFTVTLGQGGACSMMASGNAFAPQNSNFYGTDAIESVYGALALQLLVSGDGFAERGVAVSLPQTMTAVAGAPLTMTVDAKVDGVEPVATVNYAVSDGTAVIAAGQYQLPEPLAELEAPFALPVAFEAPSEATRQAMTVSVTAINGRPNGSAAGEATTTACLLTSLPHHRIVMEEATATWCNNCTRGIVGIQRLKELFPDEFVAIAMHGNDDPMMVPEYRQSTIGRKMTSLPICYFDRVVAADPYIGTHAMYDVHFYADEIVRERLATPTVADIAVGAAWGEEDGVLEVDAATTFRYGDASAPYALALVLMADGLHGEGNAWTQINGYSSSQGKSEGLDEDMAAFVNAPYRLEGYRFNHVAVAVHGIDNGIEGSITAPLVADAEQHYRYTWDISDNTLIQDRSKLQIAALLINTETRAIVNAAVSEVPVPTAIKDITTQEQANGDKGAAMYDMSGRRIDNGQWTMDNGQWRGARGVVIERRADGSAVKRVNTHSPVRPRLRR